MFLLYFFFVSMFLSFSFRISRHHRQTLSADATLLELEKTLLDATAKFTTSNPYNTSYQCNNSRVTASRDNCILNSPLSSGRAVMCKYDDEMTRKFNDEHNVMHLQSKGMSIASAAAPTAHASCSNVKYLNLADNKCRNSRMCQSSSTDPTASSPIVIVNATSHSNLLNFF